jgi:ribosomal protein L3 glutamine methyltransferase
MLGAARHLQSGGILVMEIGSGRQRVEHAFPRTEFTWADTPGGGGVLILTREQLPT